ncbi:MAG TPA: hypothetical protein ENH91_00295 [Leeuwenhoekiella sp.]|nr:hypothetical protein [Leeuwenhoekiella sp.]
MKIRIKENTVRFRLTRSEVEQVCATGNYEEYTAFDSDCFSYGVTVKEDIEYLTADFTGKRITLYLPKQFIEKWQNTDRVGFEHTMLLKNGKSLFLLLEKDFVCMDDTREDQADNYPNPLAEKLL